MMNIDEKFGNGVQVRIDLFSFSETNGIKDLLDLGGMALMISGRKGKAELFLSVTQ